MTSESARKVVTDFALDYRRNGDTPHVAFYFIDLTNAQQNAPTHVTKWLSSDALST